MAGFKTDGSVADVGVDGQNVVFCLKSESGRDIKSYKVPAGTADQFEEGIKAEEPKLREEAGETDPLRLLRISRCF